MKPRIKPPSFPAPKLEIINLIDVLITLIAFFMFTTVFAHQQQQIKVQLPSAAHGESDRATEKIEIRLTAANRIYIEGRQLQPRELPGFLQKKSSGKALVAIVADRDCQYEWVINLLDMVKSCGLTRVSLNVQSQKKN